jgi:hypothetical protein
VVGCTGSWGGGSRLATLLKEHCNIFGAESGGGRMLGGLSSAKPTVQWYCPSFSVGRFFMRCWHGHKGQIMTLCEKHHTEFQGKVTFCPRCNMEPSTAHKCKLKLEGVS